jgi:hypothetical protein
MILVAILQCGCRTKISCEAKKMSGCNVAMKVMEPSSVFSKVPFSLCIFPNSTWKSYNLISGIGLTLIFRFVIYPS